MFTNLKSVNPLAFPGELKENPLYQKFFDWSIQTGEPIIPIHKIETLVHGPISSVANIGFVLYDNYRLKYTHHVEQRKWMIGQRLAYIMDNLIMEAKLRVARSNTKDTINVLKTLEQLNVLFQDQSLNPETEPDSPEQDEIWDLVKQVTQYQHLNLIPSYDHYRIALNKDQRLPKFKDQLWLPSFQQPQPIQQPQQNSATGISLFIQPQPRLTITEAQPSVQEGPIDDMSGGSRDYISIDDSDIEGESDQFDTLSSSSSWSGGGQSSINRGIDSDLDSDVESSGMWNRFQRFMQKGGDFERHAIYPIAQKEELKCLRHLQGKWIEEWQKHYQQSEDQLRDNPVPSWSTEPRPRNITSTVPELVLPKSFSTVKSTSGKKHTETLPVTVPKSIIPDTLQYREDISLPISMPRIAVTPNANLPNVNLVGPFNTVPVTLPGSFMRVNGPSYQRSNRKMVYTIPTFARKWN